MIDIYTIGSTIVFEYSFRNKITSRLEVIEVSREDISTRGKGLLMTSLETYVKYRGKGYATKLIERLINFCIEFGYRYILLDDATDVLPPKNIYYKFGFMVKDDDGKWVKWKNNMQPDEERLLKIY
jgi:GNAT superfamily N-acetyltransferase